MKHMLTLVATLLGLLPLASWAAEELPGNPVTVGNPAEAAQLPAALQAAYSGGARDITIAPGTYVIPATGRSASDTKLLDTIRDTGLLRVGDGLSCVFHGGVIAGNRFEQTAKPPIVLKRCSDIREENK
jgi:hypothetical protein